LFHLGLVIVIIGIRFSLEFFQVFCHEIHAEYKLLLDEVLLIVLVQLEEFVELIATLIVHLTILVEIFSGEGVFIAGSFAFSAQHLYLLRIILVFHECFTDITSVCEKEMPAQLISVAVFHRHFMEGALVHTIVH